MAAHGLISYRAKGRYGYIMIGAKDDDDAWREARRSTDSPTDLEIWDGKKYIPVKSNSPKNKKTPLQNNFMAKKKSPLSKALDRRKKKSAKKSIKQAAPQSESYSTKRDKKEKAKPAGYRFKGLDNFKTPTKKEIAADAKKPRAKRKTYFENRKDKSDKKPAQKLKRGGIIVGKIGEEIVRFNSPKDKIAVIIHGYDDHQFLLMIRKAGHSSVLLNNKIYDSFDSANKSALTAFKKNAKSISDFGIEIKYKINQSDISVNVNGLSKNEFIVRVRENGESLSGVSDEKFKSITKANDKAMELFNSHVKKFELGGSINAHSGDTPLIVQDNMVLEQGGPILPEDATQSDVMEHGGQTVSEPVIEEPKIEIEPEVKIEPKIEIKLETTQKVTIPNFESAAYAENLIEFMGTNLEGKSLPNGDYVVLSFLFYPIWFYCAKEQQWYGNTDKFNSVTAMHISQSRPTTNAEMLPIMQLLDKMNQGIAQYDLGGVLVRQLYPMTFDNTTIAHQ